MRKNFALIGVGGYIAPRHLQAIRDTGNTLVAALDRNDSVGILDRFFPDVDFFLEFERFDRHVDKLRRGPEESRVQYVSICSPNYLHDSHIRFALRSGAHAICEKPLVLNPWNLDALQRFEEETGKRIFNILQLRVHPSLLALRERILSQSGKRFSVNLSYITSRGPWYQYSWKGSLEKSGGIATNIGIHFFDLLIWFFGAAKASKVFLSQHDKAAGYLELERADVKWYLSIDRRDLPSEVVQNGKSTYRSISLDQQEVEFSEGFGDLHTLVYKNILQGSGFSIDDVRPSIEVAHRIRNAPVEAFDPEMSHPFLLDRSFSA